MLRESFIWLLEHVGYRLSAEARVRTLLVSLEREGW
jgi:hypothetical protein